MDTINILPRILDEKKARRVFLVTGRASYEVSGAKDIIETLLKNCEITRFCDFPASPNLDDIRRGIAVFKHSSADVIIAVGGGSVMDMAKSVNILAEHDEPFENFVRGEKTLERRGKTLIAIPTTAGSGSEATHFAVVYIGKQKYSLAHESMLPNYAIVDQRFTFKLPPRITASTGIDALSQAIESFWSLNATEESKKYSRRAIALTCSFLTEAVNSPASQARAAMSEAAHLAGKAINIAKTTACHAISYPITAYFGVPHGHAVGLTLPQMFLYNAEALDSGDLRGLLALLGVKTPEEGAEFLESLMRKIGLETRLSQLNINFTEAKKIILEEVFKTDRVRNNPRPLTKEALEKILDEIK